MHILVEVIPPHFRRYIYAAFALIGVILGAWRIADPAAWVDTALAVYAFVGGAVGLTANANTPDEDEWTETLYEVEDVGDDPNW